MPVELEFLRNVSYFSGLDIDELGSVMGFVFEKKAERSEVLILEGEQAEALYFVFSGAVKVFKTSIEGKEQILRIVRPGESFNDVSVFDGGSNPASAQAMGPVILYAIRVGDLQLILREHPEVALNVIKILAGQIRYLVSLVEDLSFRHVIGRVAKILLEYAGDGTKDGSRLTQQEMAAMAGTVREVVGRSLKALEDKGAIRLDRHRIVIIDREVIERLIRESV